MVFAVAQFGWDGVLHSLAQDDCVAFVNQVVDQLDDQFGSVVEKLKAVDVERAQLRLDA